MTSSSDSSQSSRPTGRVLMKNYSSFLDFTRNYERASGIFVPWGGSQESLVFLMHQLFAAIVVRTSDGGNGNHSVSLPIILIKIKVDQMFPSSYISSLLVSILWFCIWFPISINVRLYFGAKMVTFCIIHIGNRKIFLKHHSPPSPN